MSDSADEEAVFWIAKNDRGAGVTAGAEGLSGIEGETCFPFSGAVMAFVALLGEEGTDAFFEEFVGIFGRFQVETRACEEGDGDAEEEQRGNRHFEFYPANRREYKGRMRSGRMPRGKGNLVPRILP